METGDGLDGTYESLYHALCQPFQVKLTQQHWTELEFCREQCSTNVNLP